MLPLSSSIEFSTAAALGIALVLGLGFGFCLERAGFGSARKLTAVFYLWDMAVVKVMFTAIVTAMVLLFGAVGLGILDFSQVWVNPTYLWSGILGGLIMGVGFIVGGFCPTTSLASASTGKIDGKARDLKYSVGGVSADNRRLGINRYRFCKRAGGGVRGGQLDIKPIR